MNKNFDFLKLPICEIRIFESIYAFRINEKHSNISSEIVNKGKFFGLKDLRHSNTSISKAQNLIKKSFIFEKYSNNWLYIKEYIY